MQTALSAAHAGLGRYIRTNGTGPNSRLVFEYEGITGYHTSSGVSMPTHIFEIHGSVRPKLVPVNPTTKGK